MRVATRVDARVLVTAAMDVLAVAACRPEIVDQAGTPEPNGSPAPAETAASASPPRVRAPEEASRGSATPPRKKVDVSPWMDRSSTTTSRPGACSASAGASCETSEDLPMPPRLLTKAVMDEGMTEGADWRK